MRAVTIVQARTSSSRLPAKALLKISGYPTAILAALRAANRGQETIFATSSDPSDDELAAIARAYGLKVFRGPLHDVLARYYLASSDLPEDCVVVRLTADNVVPDGQFVEELARAFAASNVDYVNTGWTESGLPYGLGAEAFSIRALRRAHRAAETAEDREHVGPWIRRNCTSQIYCLQRENAVDYSHLRCTIDDEEDFERLVRVFDSIADPLNVPWQFLLHRLACLPGQARFRIPYRAINGCICSNLTLGTAQLGMSYGIVNDSGKPSREQAIEIIRTAVAHGVTAVDTARGYGTAEEIVGEALSGTWGSRAQVITKVDFSGLSEQADESEVRTRVDETVRSCCDRLNRSQLRVLLLHRWHDRDRWHGAAWQRLLELRAEGKIRLLGASVYQPEEALSALEDASVEHLQIPINVLDWRWQVNGVNIAAKSRPDVVIHARSVLLQGILSHPANRWPVVEGFDALCTAAKLTKLAERFGRESVTDLCFAYVRSLPWVTSSVVGCETMAQLHENLRLSRSPNLTEQQCEQLREELPRVPENLLNPSKWNTFYETRASH